LDVNKKSFKCKRLVICAQEPANLQKALTMLIEKRYKDEDTGSDGVNLFSRCLFFLIKASKKDNYQLENKEIKN